MRPAAATGRFFDTLNKIEQKLNGQKVVQQALDCSPRCLK